uniref:Uncharacterized protein n=1 Tax=Sphaerodactylus townsendi TaxID=933632 RepID=A0ACB8F2Z7_9SAUR
MLFKGEKNTWAASKRSRACGVGSVLFLAYQIPGAYLDNCAEEGRTLGQDKTSGSERKLVLDRVEPQGERS